MREREERNEKGKHAGADRALGRLQRIAIPRHCSRLQWLAERVVDTSCSGKEEGERDMGRNESGGNVGGGETGTNLAAPSFPRRVTR